MQLKKYHPAACLPRLYGRRLAAVLLMMIAAYPASARRIRADLIIRGGTVVTMDASRHLIEDGFVAVKDGTIIAVGTEERLALQYSADEVIDARGKLVIPGLINGHTHIPMSLFRGISDDLELHRWLSEYIFPAEARNVTEAFVRAGARLALAEMIRGGTTTFCDMYYFEDAVAEETARVGMRAILGETIINFPSPDHPGADTAIAYAERFIRKWKNHPLIIPAIAPHSPYLLAAEHLRRTRQLSDELKVPQLIHLSETRAELENAQKEHGLSPVQYLEDIQALNSRTIAAHAVHVSDTDMSLLRQLGTGIVHNPQSNMKLASGIAPVPEMLEKGLPVGLGTDGAASNNDLSMWEEMDMAAKLHKVFTGDPQAMPAIRAFEMATIMGARALHIDSVTGSIEPGKRGDMAVIDIDGMHQIPVYQVYSALVYTTKASDVRTVIINGKTVMKDRKLLTLDEHAIRKETEVFRQRIINSLKQ